MRGLGAVLLLVGCCGLQEIHAANNVQMIPERPGHPGQCYDPNGDNNMYYNIGSTWYKEGVCEMLYCSTGLEPGTVNILHQGCSADLSDPLCTLTDQDLSQRYPDCCGSVVCP